MDLLCYAAATIMPPFHLTPGRRLAKIHADATACCRPPLNLLLAAAAAADSAAAAGLYTHHDNVLAEIV